MEKKMMTLLIMCALFLVACRPVPMNKVIEEDIPFNVQEVIHKEKVKDGVILLYVTRQKNKQGEFDAITVAFLKGNDQVGWENAGHNHWEHKENELLTTYTDVFYDYDYKGNLENRIPVIYGKIESKEIKSVEVFGKDQKLEHAHIIEKINGRYFLKLGDYENARGLLSDGKAMGDKIE
ncbi:hypothetical protein KHA94_13130 [Bacillus sp. FJAT-49705]|uniref:Lipoprotein n=1 Tax=Cytobacillus citreus TaxID=2833586 RepID=A0ABS5NTG1_9BACI|nr:hypothetical protein [Cytobacillus citreus]MBS4191127.1 hypothetical protein [Cytobacillus citreus]